MGQLPGLQSPGGAAGVPRSSDPQRPGSVLAAREDKLSSLVLPELVINPDGAWDSQGSPVLSAVSIPGPGRLAESCRKLGSALNAALVESSTALRGSTTPAQTENVLDRLWVQTDAEQYQAECRAYATADLAAEVEDAHTAATYLHQGLSGLLTEEAQLVYELQQQVLSNVAAQKQAHRALLDVVDCKDLLSDARQRHDREARSLMDESEWVAIQLERASEERAVAALKRKLAILQESSARELDDWECQLAARHVRAAHAQAMADSAQEQLESLTQDTLALQEAVLEAHAEEALGRPVPPHQRTTLPGNAALQRTTDSAGVPSDLPLNADASYIAPDLATLLGDVPLSGTTGPTLSPRKPTHPPAALGQAQAEAQQEVFGDFVRNNAPVPNLERLQLKVGEVAALPAPMRTAYLRTLSQHFAHLHNLNEHLKMVLQATGEFSRSHDFLDTLECIAMQASTLLDCHTARVLVLDVNANVFRCMQVGQDGNRVEARMVPAPGLVLGALSAGPGTIKIHRHLDPELIDELPECDMYFNLPLHNCMIGCVGHPAQPDTTIAVLQVFNKSHDRPFSDSDYLAMRILLEQAAVPLDNAIEFDTLGRKDATLDELQELASHLLRASCQPELVDMLAVRGKKVAKAQRLMVTLLEIPITQAAAATLTPVTSPRSSTQPHSSGFRLDIDDIQRTEALEQKARRPRSSRSRRTSFARHSRPISRQTSTRALGAGAQPDPAAPAATDHSTLLHQAAQKLQSHSDAQSVADSRVLEDSEQAPLEPAYTPGSIHSRTSHRATFALPEGDDLALATDQPHAVEPLVAAGDAVEEQSRDGTTQQLGTPTLAGPADAGGGVELPFANVPGAEEDNTFIDNDTEIDAEHTTSLSRRVSFFGKVDDEADESMGRASSKAGLISRPTSASATTRLQSMGILLTSVEAVEIAASTRVSLTGEDDEDDIDGTPLDLPTLPAPQQNVAGPDPQTAVPARGVTAPAGVSPLKLPSALKSAKSSPSKHKPQTEADLSRPSLVFEQTRHHMNPRQRRSSISAYTNYQQEIGLTPLVKEALRRGAPVVRSAAQEEPTFDKVADSESGFFTTRLLIVPLVHPSNGTMIGALQFVRGWPTALEPEEPWRDATLDPFSAEDIETAEMIAEQAVVAVDNVRMAAGVSDLPQLLSDVPEGLGLSEAAGRIMGSVMQVCPCEEVHILMRNSMGSFESQESGPGWYYEVGQGLDDPRGRSLHPTNGGIMEACFVNGWITLASQFDPEASPSVWVKEEQVPWEVRPRSGFSRAPQDPPNLANGFRTLLCIPVFGASGGPAPAGQSLHRSGSAGRSAMSMSAAKKSVRSGMSMSQAAGMQRLGNGDASNGSGVVAVIQLVNRLKRNQFDRCDMVLLKGLAAQASVLLAAAGLQVELRAMQRARDSLLQFVLGLSQHLDLPATTPGLSMFLTQAVRELTDCDAAGVLWVDESLPGLVEWDGVQGAFVSLDEDDCEDVVKASAGVMLTPLRFHPGSGNPIASPLVEKSLMTSSAGVYCPILSKLRMPPRTKTVHAQGAAGEPRFSPSPVQAFGGAALRFTGFYGVLYCGRYAVGNDVQVPDFSDTEVEVLWQAAQHVAAWIDGSMGLDLSLTR